MLVRRRWRYARERWAPQQYSRRPPLRGLGGRGALHVVSPQRLVALAEAVCQWASEQYGQGESSGEEPINWEQVDSVQVMGRLVMSGPLSG